MYKGEDDNLHFPSLQLKHDSFWPTGRSRPGPRCAKTSRAECQASPGAAPIQYDPWYIDTGAPIDRGRFKPKARIKGPIFLTIFVAQVLYRTIPSTFLSLRANTPLHRHDVAHWSPPSPTSLRDSASCQRWRSQLGYPKADLEAVSGIVQGRPLHWAGLRCLHLNGVRLTTFQTHRVSPAFRHCSGLSPVHNVSHPCSDVY